MTYFPQAHPQRRALRIHMPMPVSAIVVREDGQHTNCKLQTISVTGGLLQVGQPLLQGGFVELAFQTNFSTVHGMAEMLPSVDGRLQPFRFIALDDGDHRALRMLSDIANDPKTFHSASTLRQL